MEVLSRERYANRPHPYPSPEGRGKRREHRIDQRMPLKSITDFFLPSEESASTGILSGTRSNKFKRCYSRRKPGGNDWDKAGVVIQAQFHLLSVCVMEGMFYLMAYLLLLKACPRMPFLLPVPTLTPALPLKWERGYRSKQESGRLFDESSIE